MKKTIVLLIVIAILILGGYFGMGVITERTLKKNLSVVNQSNGIQAHIKDYHRGWFSSNAVLTWEVHIPAREKKDDTGAISMTPAQDFQTDMPITIYHGPIIFVDGVHFGLGYGRTELSLPESLKEKFDAQFSKASTPPIIKVSLFVNYLCKSTLGIDVPAFTLQSNDSTTQLKWFGAETRITAAKNLSTLSGSIEIDGLEFSKGTTKLVAGKADSDYDLHRTKQGLFLGDANLRFPTIVVTDNNQKVFDLADFEMDSKSEVDNGLFGSTFSLSFDKLFADKKNYGPAKLALSIRNLDAEVLGRINRQANEIQQGSDTSRQQLLFQLLPEVPKLFARGPVFEVSELSLQTPEGKIEGQLKISLPESTNDNPFQMIQKIQGKAKLSMPASLVQTLLYDTVKRRLERQQLQVSQNTVPPEGTTMSSTPAPTGETPTTTTTETTVTTAPKLTIEEDARTETNRKLSELLESGALVQSGDNYVIELNFTNGHLTVNGQAFNSAMIKF